jgi:hypothetical protein
MQTLSYGYKLPETGDRGNVWFPALEDNITRLNSHDHDGTDSPAIPVQNLTKSSASILAADWVSQGGGTYRQEITMPAGFTYANTIMKFMLAGTDDDEVHPTVEEGSASNKFYVYVNDNTVALTVLYV